MKVLQFCPLFLAGTVVRLSYSVFSCVIHVHCAKATETLPIYMYTVAED